MSKRVYSSRVKKWAIGLGIGGVPLAVLLISLLLSLGAVEIISYSGDHICVGTEENPCITTVTFKAKTDIFIYPDENWAKTPFSTDPQPIAVKMYRSWGTGWRELKLNQSCTGTWCGLSNSKDIRKFAYAFREGRTYTIKYEIIKENPEDELKWNFAEAENLFLGITKENIYGELIENKADIASGYAIFEIYNPIEELSLDDFNFQFKLFKGTDVTRYELLVNSSEGYIIDKIPIGWNKIKLIAYWKPHVGKQTIDWVPQLTLKKDLMGSEETLYISNPEWAIWDVDWGRKKQVNVTGGTETLFNFTFVSIVDKETDMQTDFDDIRWIDSIEANVIPYYPVSYNNTAAIFKAKSNISVGTNIFYMYYDNDAASSGEDRINAYDQYTLAVYDFEETGENTTSISWNSHFNLTKSSEGGYNISWGEGIIGGSLNTSVKSGDTSIGAGMESILQFPTAFKAKFTLSVWVWANRVVDSNHIVTFEDAKVILSTNDADGKGKFTTDDAGGQNNALTTDVLQTKVWLRLTGTSNGWIIQIFRNGTNEQNISQNIPDSGNADIRIGFSPTNSGYDNGKIDDVILSNVTRSAAWIMREYQNFDTSLVTFNAEVINDIIPVISLISPVEGTNSSNNDIAFNCTALDEGTANNVIENVSLYIDNLINFTVSDGVNNKTELFTTINDFSEGNHNWTCLSVDDGNREGWASSNFTLNIDTINPNIQIIFPEDNTNHTSNTIDVNYNVSDGNLESCWYSNDTYAGNISLANCVNITTVTWSQGYHNVTVYANDSFSKLNSSSVTFFIDSINPQLTIISPENISFSLIHVMSCCVSRLPILAHSNSVR